MTSRKTNKRVSQSEIELGINDLNDSYCASESRRFLKHKCVILTSFMILNYFISVGHAQAENKKTAEKCISYTLRDDGIEKIIRLPQEITPYQYNKNTIYASFHPHLNTKDISLDGVSNIPYTLKVSINPEINTLVKSLYKWHWAIQDIPWFFNGTSRTITSRTNTKLDDFCTPFGTGDCPRSTGGFAYYALPPDNYFSYSIELTSDVSQGHIISGPKMEDMVGAFSLANFISASRDGEVIIEALRERDVDGRHRNRGWKKQIYREYFIKELGTLIQRCQ